LFDLVRFLANKLAAAYFMVSGTTITLATSENDNVLFNKIM